MIVISLSPNSILTGQATDVVLRLTNAARAACTNINLTLQLSAELLLVQGHVKLQLRSIAGNSFYDHHMTLIAEKQGTHRISLVGYSYRGANGSVMRPGDGFVPLLAKDRPSVKRASSARVVNDECPAENEWHTAQVRELLAAALSDEELTTLCFDHFRAVYESFGEGMSKRLKIQYLIEHCERHLQMEQLLDLVQELRPAQYARFENHLH